MILGTVLIFLALILLLVVSHELGHFLTAKWYGVRVDEFGVGLPPRLWGHRVGETLYSINWLPFGGFVKIFGEEEDIHDPRSFSAQSFWRRTLIVVAGVIANVVVGFVIFSFLAWYGTPRFGVEIAGVAPNSPAATAGFREHDVIVGIGSWEVDTLTPRDTLLVEEVQRFIDEWRGAPARFLVERDGMTINITASPRVEVPEGEGPLGIVIAPKEIGLIRTSIIKAPLKGAKTTFAALAQLVSGLVFLVQSLFATGHAPGEIIGPVGIAGVAQATFVVGIRYFLQLIAFLSLNLAVINILPIPALDGGRILFFVIEKVFGTKIPARTAGIIHSVFFILLITFLLWVTYHDILRLI